VGHAASKIVKYAGREKIDLIVLGMHGRSGLARVLMGSVAEEVVRTGAVSGSDDWSQSTNNRGNGCAGKGSPVFQSHCLVCAKPSQQTICDTCKVYIQGEALEPKRRDEQAGHRGLTI
jgi:hypothetical protein